MSHSPDKAFGRVVLASFIGTVIEWYDFYLYGTAAALILNKLFFPEMDPVNGTLAAFATFAVGFFARPLGGVVFGHFGDRVGRKSMLVLTLVLMGVSTFLIGALPTYHQIGVTAPILLVILRFLQGFAVGGEWGGAVLMVVEHGQNRGRGFYGSLSQSGTAVGLLLSMGVFSLFTRLPEHAFMSWGWRVPFLFGIVLMLVGFIIRVHVEESPIFKANERVESRSNSWPLLEAIRTSPRNLAIIFGMRIAENSCSYVLTVFLLSYASTQLQHARSSVLSAVMTASAIGMFTLPLLGGISDRVGRRKVYLAGAASMAICAFPFFAIIENRQLWSIYLVLIVGFSFCVASMFAPQAAFFTELFPTHLRYSGSSASYQLAAAFGGGLAPLIATGLLKLSHGQTWTIALYIVLLCVLGATAALMARETSQMSLSESLRQSEPLALAS